MYRSVAVKVASSAISSIIDPGRFAIISISRDFKRAARDIGCRQEIDQVRVNCRTVRVVAVNAGIIILQNMLAMGERVIAVQASCIVTLETKAVRNLIEAGLWIKFIA